MTRAERAAERAAERMQRLKTAMADTKRALAQAHAMQRAALRAEQARRRSRVGLLAEEAGLLGWDDPTLARLLQILSGLTEATNPVTVLESLLTEVVSSP